MTNFINCYGNIQSQITRLHIDGVSSMAIEQVCKFYSQDYFIATQSRIYTCMGKTNLTCWNMYEYFDQGVIQVNGLYGTLFNFGFDIFCKIKFMTHTSQIIIYFTLMRNFLPFRILNKCHRISINKLVLKINSTLKYGNFRLDPNNGEFCLCLNSTMNSTQFQSLIEKPQRLTAYLEEEFIKSKYFYRTYIFKILHLINEVPQNMCNSPVLTNNKVKILNQNIFQFQETLNRIIPTMHLEYPFMFSDNTYSGSKPLTVDLARKLIDAIKASKSVRKPLISSVLKILKGYCPVKKDNTIEDTFSQEEKKNFAMRLLEPIVKYQRGEQPYVYSQIQIINWPTSWQIIDQGGFGIISKGWVKFIFKKQSMIAEDQEENHSNLPLFTRQLVKKEDFHIDLNKLTHEKKILATLKNISTPFVAKFYYSEQTPYKNTLLIQYCSQKSLKLLKLKNNQFMSLHSKLTYLKYLAQGIKFLKDHDIVHLDIKPTNLLFGSGVVKLTDFGESYHPQVCQKNFRPGTSIPYAPPESFSSGFINFNSKMDIFSFGMVMFELLYQCYPFDYISGKYQQYKKAYFQKNYSKLMMLVPQKIPLQGYLKIHYFLKLLALRCMDQDQRRRPCVQWVIIILQYCINLQMHLYI